MRLTERQLNRTLLRRQLLVEREPVGVVEAVRRLVGLQAQQAAAPYVALWNRIADFAPAELDAAFAEHRIVKATLLRITLHAVAVEDREVFHAAMVQTLRAARLGDRAVHPHRTDQRRRRCQRAHLLTFLAEPRSNAEVDAFFAERFPDLPETGIWWALRTYAPLIAWSRAAPVDLRPPPGLSGGSVPGVAECDGRTPARHGRAGPALSGGVRTRDPGRPGPVLHPVRPPVKQAFADLTDELVEHTGPDGKPVYDLAGQVIADEDTSVPPRLLGMWDNAAAGRHRPRPADPRAEHRATVIRRNGDVLPMLLVDGYVAGVWRPVEEGIEATAFRRLRRRCGRRSPPKPLT